MARIKTISQNIALYVGQVQATDTHTGASGNNTGFLKPMVGITALDYSWTQAKQDITTYGKMVSRDRIAVEPPEVPMNITYYLGAGYNEHLLGLYVRNMRSASNTEPKDRYSDEKNVLSNFLVGEKDEKNYFIYIAPQGADADSNLAGQMAAGAGSSTIGIGNGFLNSYSIEASVGNFPAVTVGIAGFNIKAYEGASGAIPAVDTEDGLEVTGRHFFIPTFSTSMTGYGRNDLEPFVLRPGDIEIDLSKAGPKLSDSTESGLFQSFKTSDVQSMTVSFDLSRQPINRLGSRYAKTRDIQFPINVNFEVTMLAQDLKKGSLAGFLSETGKYSANVLMKYSNQNIDGIDKKPGSGAFNISLKNLYLESQKWSTQVGSEPQTIATTWLGQIGGTGDLENGLFLSGFGAGGFTGVHDTGGTPPSGVTANNLLSRTSAPTFNV